MDSATMQQVVVSEVGMGWLLLVVLGLACGCSAGAAPRAASTAVPQSSRGAAVIEKATPAVAPPHPKIEELRQRLSAAIEADAEGEPLERLEREGRLDALTCTIFTGFEPSDGSSVDQCGYQLLANGTALAITVA
ncbi:MAG: hypothetical protein QM756_16605 [Polyangiaceae bacterium]